ncbi:hypothetical protein D9M68_947060 [compost metagenome]
MSSRTPLPEAMKIVLGIEHPVGVFDETNRLLGGISARSLLQKIAQEARHV